MTSESTENSLGLCVVGLLALFGWFFVVLFSFLLTFWALFVHFAYGLLLLNNFKNYPKRIRMSREIRR